MVGCYDIATIREDFTLLNEGVDGAPLVYLDSAATSLRPVQVIDTLAEFYNTSLGTVHRSVNRLARATTSRYEEARRKVAFFIGADEDSIVFVRNTTEAINMVAASRSILGGKLVLCSPANHHSALLPWMRRNSMRLVELNDDGSLSMDDLFEKLDEDVGLVCIPHVSNAMGLLTPVAEVVERAHEAGALVFVDGAQSTPHMPVDVKEMDCDFFAFSGHKMLAPFGIGALYGKRTHLERVEPLLLGGGMVDSVNGREFELKELPDKLEAGTPNVGGAIAFAAAVDYLEQIGIDAIHEHVRGLARSCRRELSEIEGLQIHGPSDEAAVTTSVSIGFPGMAAHALALLLANRFGIVVRSGHHCAEPFHQALNLPQSVRVSFYLYNTQDDVRLLCEALKQIGGL